MPFPQTELLAGRKPLMKWRNHNVAGTPLDDGYREKEWGWWWGGGTLIAQPQADYDAQPMASHSLLIYWGDLNEINKTV